MVYLPTEDMLPKAAGNAFKLILLASKRALEIANGSAKLIDAPAIEKVTTTALREILAGKVVIKEVADEFRPAKPSKSAKSA